MPQDKIMPQDKNINIYVQFDERSGEILSCRCSNKTLGKDFLIVEWKLGKNFLEGDEKMSSYKVTKEKQNYEIRKKNSLFTQGYDEIEMERKNSNVVDVVNTSIYKILEHNDNVDIKIFLYNAKKILRFEASMEFKKFLSANINDKNNFHNFYLVKKHDFTKLLQIIKIDLNNFLNDTNYFYLSEDSIEPEIDLYCRKRFTYSLERIND